jgi:hypothetical protein
MSFHLLLHYPPHDEDEISRILIGRIRETMLESGYAADNPSSSTECQSDPKLSNQGQNGYQQNVKYYNTPSVQ